MASPLVAGHSAPVRRSSGRSGPEPTGRSGRPGPKRPGPKAPGPKASARPAASGRTRGGVRASPSPRAYHHGDLRGALVRASLELLAEDGLEGLTLRSVARRVGVSHAAPKNHFGELSGLLEAVAAEGFRRLTEAMEAAVMAAPDPLSKLLEAGVAYVAFARRAPGHFRAMFHPRLGPRAPGSELEQASTQALGVLVGAMSVAQAAGVVRAGDVLELSLAAWSLVHGLGALVVDDHLAHKGLPHDAEALARTLGLHLYFGVRAM
jgi:AcrR family transcriptional regulator